MTNDELAKQWFDEVWNEKKTDLVDELVLPESVCHTDQGDFVGPRPFLPFHSQMLKALPGSRSRRRMGGLVGWPVGYGNTRQSPSREWYWATGRRMARAILPPPTADGYIGEDGE